MKNSACGRLLLVCAALWASPLPAHEGHDHADEAAPAPMPLPNAGRNSVEMASELYEAVVVNHGDHVDIYLDRFDTNEPVTGAKLSVEVGDGAAQIAEEESPAQYMAKITPLKPGEAQAISLTIDAAAGADLLGGTLEVPAEEHESFFEHLLHELSHAWVWVVGLAALALVAFLGRRALRSRTSVVAGVVLVAMSVGVVPSVDAHEGHDHAEEAAAPAAAVGGGGDRPMRLADGSLFVPKTTQRILAVRTLVATEGATPLSMRLAGEIVGDPRASAALQTVQGGRVTSAGREWPTLGAKVRRGQVLLRLTPTGSGGERATTAAESARVTQELVRARADLARLEGLEGVVSRAELEAARSQVASLAAQRAALAAPLGSGEVLTSPIDGIIASIDASPGAVVEPGQSLVTIIDPARLSVEALAFEPVVGGASAISRATVALRDGTTLEARVDGIGSQLKGGAISVRLDLTSVASGLAVGQPVVVFLERTVTGSGLSLPVDALVRTANGDRIVYEKVSAERYMPRTVRVRQVSADRVAVVAGLEPNARVVVSGAPLLAQIR